MSTAVPPMPPQPVAGGLSEPQRIINTFVAPSKTFEDIRRNASWWVPWLLVSILGLAVGGVISKKVNWEQLVRQQIENGPRAAQFESQPKEQQEQQIAIGAKFARIVVYGAPVFALIGPLIVAAILFAIFSFGFGAEIPFGRALAIVFYSWLPTLIHSVLAVITLLLRSDTENLNPNNLVATNIAYFLDKASTSRILYGLAGALDVITIWCIILMGIGFSVNAGARKVSRGGAIFTIFVLYLLYKLVFSALGWGG
jgi:hypothetical protein